MNPVLHKEPKAATENASEETKELQHLEWTQYDDEVELYLTCFDNQNWFQLLDLILQKIGLNLYDSMKKFNNPEIRVSILCKWFYFSLC